MPKRGKPTIYALAFLGNLCFLLGLIALSQLIQRNADIASNLSPYIGSSIIAIIGMLLLIYVFSD